MRKIIMLDVFLDSEGRGFSARVIEQGAFYIAVDFDGETVGGGETKNDVYLSIEKQGYSWIGRRFIFETGLD